jgi:hypothetical protein
MTGVVAPNIDIALIAIIIFRAELVKVLKRLEESLRIGLKGSFSLISTKST